MSETVIEETVKTEGLTISTIVWRLFNAQPAGYIETILDYNQDLASLGLILPVGTVIKIPVSLFEEKDAERDIIRLWD